MNYHSTRTNGFSLVRKARVVRKSWLFILLAILAGCATALPNDLRQSLTVVVPHRVDFAEIEYYAARSSAAYDSSSKIRADYPNTTRIRTVASVDVKYFVETDPGNKRQTISFRGTANKQNIWQDAEIALVKDNQLNLNLQRGFKDDSTAVYNDLKPYLRKGYDIRLTGHSLGGAIAMIVAGLMQVDGFALDRLVTFGQPKITDDDNRRIFTKTTRVVRNRDIVPMLPPSNPAHEYRHVGPELVLKKGADYAYLDVHDAERISVGQFWRNISSASLKEHHVNLYLTNIQAKVKHGAKQVPYFKSQGEVSSSNGTAVGS